MKRNSLTIVILGLLLTSCGLMDKFKTSPSQSEESIPTVDSSPTADASIEAKTEELDLIANEVSAGASLTEVKAEDKVEIKAEEKVADKVVETQPVVVAQAETAPVVVAPKEMKVEEVIPEVKSEVVAEHSEPHKIKFYKVKKGETLMQIAFKLYGDLSKWKDLKKLNQEKVSRNTVLPANLTLKYAAPATEFVWNPEGIAYLIKNGETLGIISNNVYHTPKKWKSIYDNNRPLIKNPNIIYSGFTLYYKNDGLANYVQPKPAEKADIAQELKKAQESSTTEDAVQTAERELSSEKEKPDSTL